MTRVALPDQSFENPRNGIHQGKKEEEKGDGSWISPTFKKSIIIIIDALRYDFAYYDPSYETLNESDIPPYINKLPIFNHLMSQNPNGTFLFPFIVLLFPFLFLFEFFWFDFQFFQTKIIIF